MAARVIHFEIQADDIGRAKAFYEAAFGWKIEQMMKKDDAGGMDYWGVVTGPEGTPGINGGMYVRPADKKIHTFDCTILVENIEAAMETVKQSGGSLEGGKMEIPGVGLFARAADTEGNMFGMIQPTDWKPN